MSREELLSKTISTLRFPLAVGIVFIHNQMDRIEIQGEVIEFANWPVVKYAVDLFSQVLPRIAVPLFFLFSGYLFFSRLGGHLIGMHGRRNRKVVRGHCLFLTCFGTSSVSSYC